jgi:hypothetical protein
MISGGTGNPSPTDAPTIEVVGTPREGCPYLFFGDSCGKIKEKEAVIWIIVFWERLG